MGGRVPLGLMKRVVYVVCKHMMRTLHYMEDDVCNVQACGGGLRHFTPSDEGLDIAGIVVWTTFAIALFAACGAGLFIYREKRKKQELLTKARDEEYHRL